MPNHDVTAVVADQFAAEGMPLESAEKYAYIAVEAVRQWCWTALPCTCDDAWSSRDLTDPSCSAHDLDIELGGDGDGNQMTPERLRERLAASAVRLREQYGEDLYQQLFAPWYAQQLEQINHRS